MHFENATIHWNKSGIKTSDNLHSNNIIPFDTFYDLGLMYVLFGVTVHIYQKICFLKRWPLGPILNGSIDAHTRCLQTFSVKMARFTKRVAVLVDITAMTRLRLRVRYARQPVWKDASVLKDLLNTMVGRMIPLRF